MKKNAFLLIATVILLACSGADNNENSAKDVLVNEPQPAPKKEVIKDYDYFVKRIANDEKWMEKLEKQALERGISIDSMLIREANYMVNYQDNKAKELMKQINKIKSNSEWMQKIEKQSLERGVSIDSMLKVEAIYMINNKQ